MQEKRGVFLLMNFFCESNKGARTLDLTAVCIFLTSRVYVRTDVYFMRLAIGPFPFFMGT